MQYLVILTVLGLLTGLVGRRKGSSFAIWFIVGAVLPFFGLIAALLYRREGDELKRHCPECGSVLAITDQVCSTCGRDLDFPRADDWPPAGAPGALRYHR